MFIKNFEPEEGYIDIPSAFSKVISDDANFESVSSNLAQELRLYRQNETVGKKLVVCALKDTLNEQNEAIIKIAFDFFKT